MDVHSTETWDTILGKIPAPEGVNSDKLCAERVLGDLVGYNHPSGNANTYRRRRVDKDRDVQELTNAMLAFARMYFDAGVRP